MESPQATLLLTTHDIVYGIDEVGRGAWAGPVTVGVCATKNPNTGGIDRLNDSKKLTRGIREKLYQDILNWTDGVAITYISAAWIDTYGLSKALSLGARAGLEVLETIHGPGPVLLDGPYDYINAGSTTQRQVHTGAKMDTREASVAAAAVIAKVQRDQLMAQLDPHDKYGWARNAGYGAGKHVQGVAEHGLCEHHRHSYKHWTETQKGPGDREISIHTTLLLPNTYARS